MGTVQPNNARRRASTSQSQYAVVVVLASDTSADVGSVSSSMTTFVDTELKPALQSQGLCSSKNPCAFTSPKKIASITTTTGTDASTSVSTAAASTVRPNSNTGTGTGTDS